MRKNQPAQDWVRKLDQSDLAMLRLVLGEVNRLYSRGKSNGNNFYFVVPISDIIGGGITKSMIEEVHHLLLVNEHILSFLGGLPVDSFYSHYFPIEKNDGSHIVIWHGDWGKIEALVAITRETDNPKCIYKVTNPKHFKVYDYKGVTLITNEGDLIVRKQESTDTEIILKLLFDSTNNKVHADEVYSAKGYALEQFPEARKRKEFYHLCRHLNEHMATLNVPKFLKYKTKEAYIRGCYL